MATYSPFEWVAYTFKHDKATWALAGHSQCSGLVIIRFTPKKNNELIFIQCGNRMCHIFLKYLSATFLPVLMKTAVRDFAPFKNKLDLYCLFLVDLSISKANS